MEKLQVKRENGNINVYLGESLVCELRKERFLRFRASGETDNWIGSEKSPADLSVAYSERRTKGCDIQHVAVQCDPVAGTFEIDVVGTKPKLSKKNTVHYTVRGHYLPEKRGMAYEMAIAFTADVEDWYQMSDWARPFHLKRPQEAAPLQMTDYHVEQISHTEIRGAKNKRDGRVRYPWFFSSADGTTYEKWPKIHVPYTTMPGNYCTVRVADRLGVGACYGYADVNYGGWKETVLATSHPLSHEICWAIFDVHIILPHAVPPRTTKGDFTAAITLGYEPLLPDECADLLENAVERSWRTEPVYRLPILTGNDTFNRLINEVPSEETAEHMVYWASDSNCFRDDQVGSDDHYSLSIKRTERQKKPSAWIASLFLRNIDGIDRVGRKIRLSVMVKTENCTGKVRLVYVQGKCGGTVFYGFDTHRSDGTPRTDLLDYTYSSSVNGTHDFMPFALEVPCTSGNGAFFLEMSGCGQCWFDEVKIEDCGPCPAVTKVVDDFSENSDDMHGWSCNAYDTATMTDENVFLDKSIGASLIRKKGALVLSSGGRVVREPLEAERILPQACASYVSELVFVPNCTGGVTFSWSDAPVLYYENNAVYAQLPCGKNQLLLSNIPNGQAITVRAINQFNEITYTISADHRAGTAAFTYDHLAAYDDFRVTMSRNARGSVAIQLFTFARQ